MSRVVLVTGANRGIGLGIAERFAKSGHRVAGTYRSTPGDLDGVLWVPADVSDTESVEAAFAAIEAELGAVEICVCNAGINHDGPAVMMSDESFASVVDTNLMGSFRVAKRAARKMMRARWGRIVLMSSVVARSGQVGQVNYAASKAGMIGMARSLAKELGSRNVTVNVVSPGPIPTDMFEAVDEGIQDAITRQVPLGRFGSVEEVAAAVEFLSSEDAGYITGAVLPVDGGLGMGG